MALAAFAVAGLLYVIKDTSLVRYEGDKVLVTMFGLVMVTAGLAMISLMYLRGDISLKFFDRFLTVEDGEEYLKSGTDSIEPRHDFEAELESLRAEIAATQARLASLGDQSISSVDVDYTKLVDALRGHITTTLADELFTRFQKEATGTGALALVHATYNDSAARLRNEINALTRKGNYNLVIGMVTTGLAVILLVYMVLGSQVTFDSWLSMASHYIPRITTAAFIEIFAFFFLRLYKNSLAEIKYYQDELTTLSSNRVAYEASYGMKDEKLRAAAVARLIDEKGKMRVSSTEKDQSFMDLKELNRLMGKVPKLIKAFEKFKSEQPSSGPRRGVTPQ